MTTHYGKDEYQARLAGARSAFNSMSNLFSQNPSDENAEALDAITLEFRRLNDAIPNSDKSVYSVTDE